MTRRRREIFGNYRASKDSSLVEIKHFVRSNRENFAPAALKIRTLICKNV